MSNSSSEVSRELQQAVPLFFALGDSTRIALLLQLSAGEAQSISRLSKGSALSRQSITKHLAVLAEAGLVRSQRQGREHLWELQPARLDEARAYLARISTLWDEALDRLRRFVE
jgi:DNA-binding transcriptional ArsR family regulator